MTSQLSAGKPQVLDGNSPPLMCGVLRDGTRERNDSEVYHKLQTLVTRNRHSVSAAYTGESDVYALDSANDNEEHKVMELKFVRDGSIRGYIIHDTVTDKDLLKVHFHGNTSSPIDKLFKAFVRSPVPKWDVENAGLFSHLPIGANLGLIREVFPDNRVFEPNGSNLPGVPRLEMQDAGGIGQAYYLAVSGIPEPIGEVRSALVARVAGRSEVYTQVVRNCTAEEAVLWLTMTIATDMKRQKSVTAKNQAFGAFL